MNLLFLVHLTLLTLGFESTLHSMVTEPSTSTFNGFSGPTSTRGKSAKKKKTRMSIHFKSSFEVGRQNERLFQRHVYVG